MADLVHLNYQLTLVINRFGIKLGFGDGSVEEICMGHEIDPDFFVEIASTFHDKNYLPNHQLRVFPISSTVKYLRSTHRYYLDEELPRIEKLIDKLISLNPDQKKQLNLMKNFFLEYKQELSQHMQREERTVYPYALLVEQCYNKQTSIEKLTERFASYNVATYEGEHEDVEEKLLDLKNIIIKYLPPPADNRFYNQILFNLFRLEADLNDHTRIENTLLIPTIRLMETELLNPTQR